MKPTELRIGGIYEMTNGTRRRIERAVTIVDGKVIPRASILNNDVEWVSLGDKGRPRSGRCWCWTFANNVKLEILPSESEMPGDDGLQAEAQGESQG